MYRAYHEPGKKNFRNEQQRAQCKVGEQQAACLPQEEGAEADGLSLYGDVEQIARYEKEKRYVELIDPVDDTAFCPEERVSDDYQEDGKHMEEGYFGYLLSHLMRFTVSSSAYHTPSQPAFSAFGSKDSSCFLSVISSLRMVFGHW